jgi:hypothetical protein
LIRCDADQKILRCETSATVNSASGLSGRDSAATIFRVGVMSPAVAVVKDLPNYGVDSGGSWMDNELIGLVSA